MLNYWRQTGIAGHKIQAFMALEPSNHTHVMDAVWMFGGCYIGLALPKIAQAQTRTTDLVRPSVGHQRRRRTRLLGRTRRPRSRLRLPQPNRCDLGRAANHDLGLLGGLLR